MINSSVDRIVLPTVFSAFDLYAHEFRVLYAYQAGGIANYCGNVIVGLGHVGLIMLMIKSGFAQMGFVVAVIALQLILSPWWLARYRFGPIEWLWRSLTYWQRQPMLR